MDSQQQTLVIWIIDDGKPGHRNQSLGLAEAIVRQHGAIIETIVLPKEGGFFSRMRALHQQGKKLTKPGLIIGAGHRTHIPLIYLAHKMGARSLVLMRPSLPCAWFDHCLIPEHDFAEGRLIPTNVILTKGALNRVTYDPRVKDGSGLFLIGGESKEFEFDGETLASAIGEIVTHYPDTKWSITDSRRTPEGFLDSLKDVQMSAFPHQQTDADWLPAHLSSAIMVWVTEDSVSMIYEALSSGAQVGLLPMPRKSEAGRVARGVKRLIEEGLLCGYEAWLASHEMSHGEAAFAEAEHCAAAVIKDIT
jgi:mitochondrial fission protein ELM1